METLDDTDENENSDTNTDTSNTTLTKLPDNAPDELKDILHQNKDIPFEQEVEFIPKNPFTLNGNDVSYTSGPSGDGLKEKSGFFKTAAAEAYNFNTTAQALHAGYEKFEQPSSVDDIPPADWTPKSDESKFVNVAQQYKGYLLDATGPKDQQYRLEKVYAEQQHDETLANGSLMAKIMGGVAGIITDPMSYIPIVGWAKYAKVGAGFLKNAVRAAPGIATYSLMASASKEADRVNGNMTDFLTDAFVNTVFGTALFGVGGVVALSTDKMALWNLRSQAKDFIDGLDYKLKVNDEGIVTGYQVVPNEALSAMKVSFAQDLADSAFSKSGLFKIPYVGTGTTKLLGMPVFGSPLVNLLNSPFNTVKGIIDRVADHSIITKRVAEGQAAPEKFTSLLNMTFAKLRGLSVQMNAFHLQRNGFDIESRALGGLVNLGLNLKDKGLKLIAKDIDKTGYISREQFNDEVQDVLSNKNPSEHAPVNAAAALQRKAMDEAYTRWRKAYNLPKEWMPPRTQEGFLTRVYDTPYMNANEDKWVSSVSGWLRQADDVINQTMQPITDLDEKIKTHKEVHDVLINRPNVTDKEVKKSSDEFMSLKAKKKGLEEALQNELRSNEDLNLHLDDHTAFSADEAKQIEALGKRVKINEVEVAKRKKIVQDIKNQMAKRQADTLKSKTAKTAKGNKRKAEVGGLVLEQAQKELDVALAELDDEQIKLQEQLHSGTVDPRFYYQEKGSQQRFLKDPNNRLKFRKTYDSHFERETHAKAYYDTIMNQTAEDTINQVMARFTGNQGENPLKQRTLLIPDSILYDGKFLTNDLMAKVSNYVSYLDRRTHLKNVFADVTLDGGFAPLMENLNREHEDMRLPLINRKIELSEKLKNESLAAKEKEKITKSVAKVDKELVKRRKQFDTAKFQLNHLYEKMMGIQKLSRNGQKLKAVVMSITAWSNLPFVPLTQINDLSAIGLQHGIFPFIRDGLYPLVTSLAGILKTKDSEAFRKTLPSIDLGLQDAQMGYADRNWGSQTNPYLNMGKIIGSLQHIAHLASNFTLTNYIDNGLQRIAASIFQSNLMSILHDFKAGTISKRDRLYINKYGIDPDKWADRMIAAFKQDGGGKTKLGGYQSLFHQWQDMEAANQFGKAVFNSVKDTNINASIMDAPMWLDDNGPIGVMGSFIRGFNGWGYASVNRYVIPSLQRPDAQKLLGVMFMLGTGFLIDPFRRLMRLDDPFPESVTEKQMFWSAINNSGYFSFFANVLADANLFTDDTLLGNLKSDKYKDRTRAGLLGPAWGTANRIADVVEAAGSGEWNKADMNKAVRMIPFANSSWTYWMSKKLIDSTSFPDTRAQARALKGVS
jgi:hypothetical protein